ncbi:hypothetical protein L484_008571 [Morus notabilis]|uniref:Uncharacterized protein n=1 Tax=Morus notabilis TaxID=981085 RepID=W9QJA7_9ROSA|nr:hypothetical protein L484_008571 [Morus notabilis]
MNGGSLRKPCRLDLLSARSYRGWGCGQIQHQDGNYPHVKKHFVSQAMVVNHSICSDALRYLMS